MKIKIPLSRNPKPEFVGVARIVAEGELPEWLLQGLDHFSGGIGTDASKERKTLEKDLERITRAVDVLMKRLPIFQRLSFEQGAQEGDMLRVSDEPLQVRVE